MLARALRAGAESGPEPEPQRQARDLCVEMAAAAAVSAAEGMEPRALQYEQTLVSEAESSPKECGPGVLLVTLGKREEWGVYPIPAPAF